MKLEIPDIVRKDFEKWYNKERGQTAFFPSIHKFWLFDFEMIVGVLIAFCDSKEIYIDSFRENDGQFNCLIPKKKEVSSPFSSEYYYSETGTRKEAQISALNKAFELIEGNMAPFKCWEEIQNNNRCKTVCSRIDCHQLNN